MHEAEVGHVEEVLDNPRPLGPKKIRPSENQAKRGVIAVGKLRNIAEWFPYASPDHAISLPRLIGLRARLDRRRLIRLCRNMHALTARTVFPRMIGTHEPVAAQLAQRELSSAVDTKIAPTVNPMRGAPQHNLEAQKLTRKQLAWVSPRGTRQLRTIRRESLGSSKPSAAIPTMSPLALHSTFPYLNRGCPLSPISCEVSWGPALHAPFLNEKAHTWDVSSVAYRRFEVSRAFCEMWDRCTGCRRLTGGRIFGLKRECYAAPCLSPSPCPSTMRRVVPP